jgi:hypothetical protein
MGPHYFNVYSRKLLQKSQTYMSFMAYMWAHNSISQYRKGFCCYRKVHSGYVLLLTPLMWALKNLNHYASLICSNVHKTYATELILLLNLHALILLQPCFSVVQWGQGQRKDRQKCVCNRDREWLGSYMKNKPCDYFTLKPHPNHKYKSTTISLIFPKLNAVNKISKLTLPGSEKESEHLGKTRNWVKVKIQFTLLTSYEGPDGEYRYRSTLSLTSALDMGSWLTPCPSHFIPRNDLVSTV